MKYFVAIPWRADHTVKLAFLFLVFFANAILSIPSFAGDSAESKVSLVRRTIRQACKELNLALADSNAAPIHLSAAYRLTLDGQSLWLELLDDSVSVRTSGYANHPHWSDSTASISQGISRMMMLIDQNNPKDAVKACGSGCKGFFKLNEAAGVHRTSDDLFRIRMSLKQLENAVADGNFGLVDSAMPGIFASFNRTEGPIAGGTGTEPEIRQALSELFTQLNALQNACQSRNDKALNTSYQEALRVWDIAYGLLL